jgi:hypothetical protein
MKHLALREAPKDGGPAFPGFETVIHPGSEPYQRPVSGMMLRDYFAGQALVAISANVEPGRYYESDAATHAYALADAMIAARSK